MIKLQLDISPLQDTASISLCSWYEIIPQIFYHPSSSSPPKVECVAATNKAEENLNDNIAMIKRAGLPSFPDFRTAASSPHCQAISTLTGMFSFLSEFFFTCLNIFFQISECLHVVRLFTCSLQYGKRFRKDGKRNVANKRKGRSVSLGVEGIVWGFV